MEDETQGRQLPVIGSDIMQRLKADIVAGLQDSTATAVTTQLGRLDVGIRKKFSAQESQIRELTMRVDASATGAAENVAGA